MPRSAFIWSPEFCEYQLSESHPLKPERLSRTYELLDACGAFSRGASSAVDRDASGVVAPSPCEESDLLLVHGADYIDVVRRLGAGERVSNPWRYGLDTIDNPVFPGMYEASRVYVGATLTAADVVSSGEAEVAFNIAGGLHHAHHDRAAGFCVFNDPAAAIARLLAKRGDGCRVAYIDIDAHHGDGVQEAFYSRSDVLTISLHESGRYLFPGTGFVEDLGEGPGEGYSVNVPLAPLTDDEAYVWTFDQVVPPLVERFRPDFIVAQLGIDSHYRDPLTHLELTTRGYTALVERICALPGRLIAVGGGGYEVEVVARSWTLAYGLMAGLALPDEIPDAVASQYRASTLHDPEGSSPETRPADARRFAESVVEAIRETIFPYHGL
jgi:acetoin utilization protein AcuC